METFRSYFLKRINLCCVFILVFIYSYLNIENKWFSLDIFTNRDILRALGWLNGVPHWPGPEMSAGGNLPGPFFYFLLFPPLLFGGNIYSHCVLWLVTWFSLTWTLVFHFVSKITVCRESLLIFLGAFIAVLGPTVFYPLAFAWNACFSIMFHVLTLMGWYFWRETGKDRYLYLTGLAIALGMQVHLLVGIHAVTVILFYFFEDYRKKGLIPIFLFLFLVSFPVLLYNAMEGFHIFEVSHGNYMGHAKFLIKKVFGEKWIINIKKAFNLSYIIPLVFLLFLTIWKNKKKNKLLEKSAIHFFIFFIFPIISAVLSARMFWYTSFIPVFLILLLVKLFDNLIYDNPKQRENIFLITGFLFICFLMPFEKFATDLFSFNHIRFIFEEKYLIVSLFSAILIVWIGIFRGQKIKRIKLWKPVLFLLILFFSGYMKTVEITHYVSFKKHSAPESFLRSWPSYRDLRSMMKKIFLETNWSPEIAVKRIYTIGIWPEVSLLMNYALARERTKKNSNTGTDHPIFLNMTGFNKKVPPSSDKNQNLDRINKEDNEIPDGYMIVLHLKKFISYSTKDWYRHLSDSDLLSEFLRREILQGGIQIKDSKLYGKYWLISYNTTEKSVFKEGFYNTGQPYYWEEPEWLRSCSSTQNYKTQNGFYYCMIQPRSLDKAGVHIQFLSSKSSPPHFTKEFMEIKFYGSLIGTAERASNRYGFALWSDIQLNILCDTGRKIIYDLPQMGLDGLFFKKDITERAKSFSAPLKLSIPLEGANFCDEKRVKRLELLFNHSFVYVWRSSQNREREKKKIVWDKN